MSQDLHIVFVSELGPRHDHSVFGALCRSARSRNAEGGIAGVLLFDGDRFLHWLYGPRDRVSQLMTEISADLRHTNLRILVEASLPPKTPIDRFWRAGFVDADRLDAFLQHPAEESVALFERLSLLIDQAELDPLPRITEPPPTPLSPCADDA